MNGYSRAEEIGLGIHGLATRCGLSHSGCGESPIFVLCTGRGSGGDEVARAIANSCAFLGDASFSPGVVDALARQLIAAGFAEEGVAAPTTDVASRGSGQGTIDAVIRAQVRFYKDVGSSAAQRAGCQQWGLVLYDVPGDHAVYLRFLFPAARCLFLRRSPAQCYLSFLEQLGTPISHNETLAASFQNHCKALAASFDRWHGEVDGLLVDYERLGWEHGDQVESFLGITIPDEIRARWRSSGLVPGPTMQDVGKIAADRPIAAPAQQASETPSRDPEPAHGRREGTQSCAVLVPISRYIEPECEASLRALEERGYVVRRLYGCAAIDAARNILATRALDEGFEETLWVDSDVGFDADAVEQLRSHNLPIVCGIYAKKGAREVAAGLLPGTSEIIFGDGGGLTEVLYAATGFLHVRRHVYETIRDKLALPTCNAWSNRRAIPFFMPMIEQWGDQFTYLAEDYGFCRRARQCGFKIFADTSIRLWHIGSYRYGYEDASSEITRVKTHHFRPSGA